MSDDVEFDYDYLMQNALRGLMRDVLQMVAQLGDAPGEHHFYIEFLTKAPGVSMPDHLKEEYPERMTIVLQHQFENMTVNENAFGVTLWFKNKEARLEIPFNAVTSFADPSAQFGLRFELVEDEDNESGDNKEAPAQTAELEPSKPETEKSEEKKGDGADIVSLDSFRKK